MVKNEMLKLLSVDLNRKDNEGCVVLLLDKDTQKVIQSVKIHEICENDVIVYDIEGYKLKLPKYKFDFKILMLDGNNFDTKNMEKMVIAEAKATHKRYEKEGTHGNLNFLIFRMMGKERALFEDRNEFIKKNMLDSHIIIVD